ncbi:MAG TPA: hypothetical protein VF077_12940 [Nitrospiraceae bacterium]
MKKYVVIKIGDAYGIGCKSDEPGVDYNCPVRLMPLADARKMVDDLNADIAPDVYPVGHH